MKKNILHFPVILIATLFLNTLIFAQTNTAVGIGTANPQGALDITSTNSGLLIPRVNIPDINQAPPLTSPTVGEMVYNTRSNSANFSGDSEGYFYWSKNNKWNRIDLQTASIGVADPMITGSPLLVIQNGEPVRLSGPGFYYATYRFTNNFNDWISNFDTKIDTSKYTVIVTGYGSGNGTPVQTIISGGASYVPSLTVLAYQSAGTWRLSADYISSGSLNGASVNWVISVMIISNVMIKNLGTINQDMGNSPNGAATVSPVP